MRDLPSLTFGGDFFPLLAHVGNTPSQYILPQQNSNSPEVDFTGQAQNVSVMSHMTLVSRE